MSKKFSPGWGEGGKLCKKPTHPVENIDDMRHAGKAEVVEQLFTSVKFARQETILEVEISVYICFKDILTLQVKWKELKFLIRFRNIFI